MDVAEFAWSYRYKVIIQGCIFFSTSLRDDSEYNSYFFEDPKHNASNSKVIMILQGFKINLNIFVCLSNNLIFILPSFCGLVPLDLPASSANSDSWDSWEGVISYFCLLLLPLLILIDFLVHFIGFPSSPILCIWKLLKIAIFSWAWSLRSKLSAISVINPCISLCQTCTIWNCWVVQEFVCALGFTSFYWFW